MRAQRRVHAIFTEATPGSNADGVGVHLRFLPQRSRLVLDPIEDFACLGPKHCVPSVSGLGKVIRILRVARIAVPEDPCELLGRQSEVTEMLKRAVGTAVELEVRARSRLRFVAWTEQGVEIVDDVSEVREEPDAYWVSRRTGRFPVRVPRSAVLRQQTELQRWYEVLDILRPA